MRPKTNKYLKVIFLFKRFSPQDFADLLMKHKLVSSFLDFPWLRWYNNSMDTFHVAFQVVVSAEVFLAHLTCVSGQVEFGLIICYIIKSKDENINKCET